MYTSSMFPLGAGVAVRSRDAQARQLALANHHGSYKRVKGRSHTVEKRISMLPHKPHATIQPSRFSHTPRISTDSAHNHHGCSPSAQKQWLAYASRGHGVGAAEAICSSTNRRT